MPDTPLPIVSHTPPTPATPAAIASHMPPTAAAPDAVASYAPPSPVSPLPVVGVTEEEPPGPPVNVVPPSMDAIVGGEGEVTLTALPGEWTGEEPITYTYAWEHEGTPIPGATNASYGLWELAFMAGGVGVGDVIACGVTATDANGDATEYAYYTVDGIIISPS